MMEDDSASGTAVIAEDANFTAGTALIRENGSSVANDFASGVVCSNAFASGVVSANGFASGEGCSNNFAVKFIIKSMTTTLCFIVNHLILVCV